jgi:hypothetical protein
MHRGRNFFYINFEFRWVRVPGLTDLKISRNAACYGGGISGSAAFYDDRFPRGNLRIRLGGDKLRGQSFYRTRSGVVEASDQRWGR